MSLRTDKFVQRLVARSTSHYPPQATEGPSVLGSYPFVVGGDSSGSGGHQLAMGHWGDCLGSRFQGMDCVLPDEVDSKSRRSVSLGQRVVGGVSFSNLSLLGQRVDFMSSD